MISFKFLAMTEGFSNDSDRLGLLRRELRCIHLTRDLMSAAIQLVRGTARALDVSGSIPFGDVPLADVDWSEDPVGALEIRRQIPRGTLADRDVVSAVLAEVRRYNEQELRVAQKLLRRKQLSATILGAMLGAIVGMWLAAPGNDSDE